MRIFTCTLIICVAFSIYIDYSEATKCKRRINKVEKGRKCPKKCNKDKDCGAQSKKTCECDNWCGNSCVNKEAKCPTLKKPKNGFIVGRKRTYGRTVQYGCDEGFILSGSPLRRCQSDRKWSGSLPRCVPYSTCGQSSDVEEDDYPGRVIGGIDAKEGRWPWQTLLIRNKAYLYDQIYNIYAGFGGGTVINEEWILSAAHVFEQFKNFRRSNEWKELFLIVVGMSHYPTKEIPLPEYVHVFEPKDIYIHPSFNADNFDYDVALIRLGNRLRKGPEQKFIVDENAPKEKLVYSRYIRPVCLPCMKGEPWAPVDILRRFDQQQCESNRASSFAGTDLATVTGFGLMSKPGEIYEYPPETLQQGDLKIFEKSRCQESVKDIQWFARQARFTDQMMCAAGGNKTIRVDACRGDSGGPLVQKVTKDFSYWLQVGIVSWGTKCGGRHPGFYASVTPMMTWIVKTLSENGEGVWRDWGSWSRCSRSCGGGTHSRTRSCTNKSCVGSNSERGACNMQSCNSAGDWAEWGSWSGCLRSAGGEKQIRLRFCPTSNCAGDRVDVRDCGTKKCPTAGSGADSSKEGWYTAENCYEYYLSEDKILGATAAYQECQKKGGVLASKGIRSEEIRKEILNHFGTTQPADFVFVGAFDIMEEGTIFWSDGVREKSSIIRYWDRGISTNTAANDCFVVTIGKPNSLRGRSCSKHSARYICERLVQ